MNRGRSKITTCESRLSKSFFGKKGTMVWSHRKRRINGWHTLIKAHTVFLHILPPSDYSLVWLYRFLKMNVYPPHSDGGKCTHSRTYIYINIYISNRYIIVGPVICQEACDVCFSEINNVLLSALLPVLSFKREVSLRRKQRGQRRRGGGGVVLAKSVTCDLEPPGTQGSPVQWRAEVCWKENESTS